MRRGITSRIFLVVIIAFLSYANSYAADIGIEKELQAKLGKSRALLEKAMTKLSAGLPITDEIAELRFHAEDIKTSDILLQERFRMRQETAGSIGSKAQERHRTMEEGYLKALGEYLTLIESIQASATPPLTSPLGKGGQREVIESLKTLLDKILPKGKRPIFGTLPYKNLNYPAREPLSTPSIKPAYKGGSQTVRPDDTKDTPEAPLSLEIATLAQTLNWKPIAIYEYVKNTIETESYWGCQKGAEETLRQKSGNDCDQATLLTALLRASGFPTRYIRGTIEYFPDIEKAKNLLGMDDPLKMAEYFQKAGIPYKPVIQGGKITNIQIEHIWVESRIPYGNYRGTMIDDSDPTWLGLDTSIKPKGYTYNNPRDIMGVVSLAGLKDRYLKTDSNTMEPLEYIKTVLEAYLAQTYPGVTYNDLLKTKTIIPENMKILPNTMQFDQKKITHEYTEIPEDLKHKVRFVASNPQSPAPDPLFDITLDTMNLSNRKISMTYEPETVEDQQIMDSYGGLDNTPAYLIKLRPVLKVNEERIVVGRDGLAMGEDYTLTIELISPNSIERISSTQITGNLIAIGIVAQKAISSQLSAVSEEDDAETILYKETNRYIDRWNRAEDELASLLHLNITRPIPTVVTVGGAIDVTYLLDMPHGFEWKGVFIDANLRAVSPITHNALSITADRQKTFMQLSGLQGSILENRIFEDDFQVESISTAKLIQIVGANGGSPILTIDKTNLTALLYASDFADNIKEDITNAVNQGLVVSIPQLTNLNLQSLIPYKDWTGIGYIKENPQTGEVGFMLSGMIAGGMTAVQKDNWQNCDPANFIQLPNSKKPNTNPDQTVRIVRLNRNKADYQKAVVDTTLKTPFEVLALDAKDAPVQGLNLVFTITSGGGKIQGVKKSGAPMPDSITGTSGPDTKVTVKTGSDGIARVKLTFGQQTEPYPYYIQQENAQGEKYWELTGLNLVSVSARPAGKLLATDKPFEAYGRPGAATNMIRISPTTDIYGPPSVFASTLWLKIVDKFGNSISDKSVDFTVSRSYLGTPPSGNAINAMLYAKEDDCPGVATIDCRLAVPADKSPFIQKTQYYGVHPYLILGNTDNTKFTISATARKDTVDAAGKRTDTQTALNNIDFTFYTNAMENGYVSVYAPYHIDSKGNKVDAGEAGKPFPGGLEAVMYYSERAADRTFTVMPVLKNPPAGSPLHNDVRMEFRTPPGGGNAEPAVESQKTAGGYTATFTLGATPGKNSILAVGSVTADVPSYDAQGNATRTAKTLSGNYPIELWGLKTNVPRAQQVIQNSSGYNMSDVDLTYLPEPQEYKYTPANIGLAVYERTPTGSEVLFGFVPMDSNQKIILSKGMAKFDPANSYYGQIVVNRGTAEVRSEKIALVNAALIPDYDRNGVIDDADRERAAKGDKLYFWINDDDDAGETDGSDIPEDKMLTSINLDHEDTQVDGIRDLIDFFAVYLDLKSVLKTFDPTKHKFALKSGDSSLNFVFTDLEAQHTGYYLTGDDNNLNIPVKLGSAVSYPISATGRELLDPYSISPFLDKIASSTTENSKGIILLEGKKESTTPLEFVVLDADQKTVFSMKLNLNLAGVEKMFRHKNLTPEIYKAEKPGPGSKAGEEDRLDDRINCPDIECLGADPQKIKNFVFLHGYNVNGQQARGWQSEMFKRMFWSGSKARFWGVTWDGWDTQEIPYVGSIPFTRNYHINVEHAFDTVSALKNFLYNDVASEVTIAAHSLGNMLVSAALTNDRTGGWDAGGKIKNYFMLDAAVAAEAYGSRDDNNEVEMNKDTVTNPNMVHPDWTAYKKELWATEWHLLFKGASPIDNRESLTWRNIFSKRPSGVKYYNFFSGGEEVLDVHEGMPEATDIGLIKQTGQYAWALQEKLKGRHDTNLLLGSNYGGWGFNLIDYNRYLANGTYVPIYPSDAENIQRPELRTKPFFKKGSNNALFTEEGGSNYALLSRIELLAEAFPARTLAAGKQEVTELGEIDKFNFNMQASFKTKKNGAQFWPVERADKPNWRHNDIKTVAYPYVYEIFNEFLKKGGLK